MAVNHMLLVQAAIVFNSTQCLGQTDGLFSNSAFSKGQVISNACVEVVAGVAVNGNLCVGFLCCIKLVVDFV